MSQELVFLVNGMVIVNHFVVGFVLGIFRDWKSGQLCRREHFLLKQIREVDVCHLTDFILACLPESIHVGCVTNIDLFGQSKPECIG